MLTLGLDEASLFISEFATDDHDEIDQRPDSETAEGQQHQDAGTDLADVEAVHTEAAEEEAEEDGWDEALVAIRHGIRG